VAETDAPKPETGPNAAKDNALKNDESASAEAKPADEGSVETRPASAADRETKPADAVSAEPTETQTSASEAAKPGDNVKEAPAEAVKAATVPPPAPAATNEAPLKGDLKSDLATAYPLKKTEQVAVFVSRKDSKLYVRQNFAPLFDVPVTIAADERPLGTHIFTAQADRNDANMLHWSVVSLPVPSKAVSRRAEEMHVSHGRKIVSPAPTEAKSAPRSDSPTEALDRLNLPAEIMAKIYEAVSTGGSIIVSDQGIAGGETGEGTDFIVSLR
jgi:hypothetical protein